MTKTASKKRVCPVTITLKNPTRTYRPRIIRFIKNMLALRNLKPYDKHMWRVMDGVPFQDTETAIEVALLEGKNERSH